MPAIYDFRSRIPPPPACGVVAPLYHDDVEDAMGLILSLRTLTEDHSEGHWKLSDAFAHLGRELARMEGEC